MVSATEGANAKQGIAAELSDGLRSLSGGDTVEFKRYLRMVLPLDGYIFWIRADLVAPSAQYPNPTAPNLTIKVPGSLHYSTVQQQNEDETVGVSTVIFTARNPVQQFNDIQPNVLWIGRYDGDIQGFDASIRFAFSSRDRYYKQADLYHYVGTAVLAVFRPQIIDSQAELDALQLIVSNSLPIWLTLNAYVCPYPGPFTTGVTLYPSFILPDNLRPPYGVVHIIPDQTISHQTSPSFDPFYSEKQLARDLVRVTLYGLNNLQARTFLDAVLQYMYDWNQFGLMNMPIVRDDKRTQAELNVIAQKKIIDFEVSYNQAATRNIARQLIKTAILTVESIVPPVPNLLHSPYQIDLV